MDIKSKIENWFSNIKGKSYKIFKTSGDYNCIAYTLDIDYWMWPNDENWPSDIPRGLGIEGFKLLYKKYGYQECQTSDYEEGFDKIAVYQKDNWPTHGSKQFENKWRSKIGFENYIIEHELEWLYGNGPNEYGKIAFYAKRKSK